MEKIQKLKIQLLKIMKQRDMEIKMKKSKSFKNNTYIPS